MLLLEFIEIQKLRENRALKCVLSYPYVHFQYKSSAFWGPHFHSMEPSYCRFEREK